jgi:hypothetical protein
MATFFDVITVTCFAGLVLAFFQFTNRKTRILVHFLMVGVVLAVANQLGNASETILAFVLIVTGVGYTILVIRG